MANVNAAYDYAACFLLLLVLFGYINEKKVPMRSHRAFVGFLVTSIVATCAEISALHLMNGTELGREKYGLFAVSVRMFALFMVPLAFYNYIIVLSNPDRTRYIRKVVATLTIIVFYLAAFVANAFTGCVFELNGTEYSVESVLVAMYVVSFLVIIACVIEVFRNSDNIVFMKRGMFIVFILLETFTVAVQLLTGVPVINFAVACMCLVVFYYLQNPESVIDEVSRQFNRQFMGEYLSHMLGAGKKFSVIALALDDFKFVNKTYGVKNGDILLAQVGELLVQSTKERVVFRYGSDQFCAVIRDEKDSDIIELIMERFRHPWYSTDNQSGIMMSATMCVIQCPQDAADYEAFIEVLDMSMATAKKQKKGGVIRSSELDLDRIQKDKAIEKAIKLALHRDELMVYFQPIFSVAKGVYNSAEALVRLNDPELGFISPEIFIPIAEKNGMIVEMGEVIFEKVCRFIHDKRLADTTIEYVEVNISPVQLMRHDFVERFIAIMQRYEVTPEQINMEITETATLGAMAIVNENITRLVEYGIKFSLDDYGSGNANIAYINHMPFSIIKLDKYIVWDAFKNSKAGITLKHTIGMLNELELFIVAEGVETEDMRSELEKMGCHYMQGWLYSKAVDEDEFMRLLENAS